ncbi:hypothetical protein D9M68_756050 [compost metagenome]
MAPMPSVSHTCLLRSAPSSRSGLASAGAAMAGSSRWIMPAASRAMPPTSTKAARQPNSCPSQAASGTPSSVASVRPVITRPTARARWPGAASPAATSAATPK